MLRARPSVARRAPARAVARRRLIARPPRTTLLETANAAATSMHYVAEQIAVFTMVYCGLNWWHYRSIRIREQKKDDDQT